MKTEAMAKLIRELTGNCIFGATFTKKDGSVRNMTCRLGVKKGTNGKGLNFDPLEKGLLPVFDMQAGGFRMINLNTVTELRIKGEIHRFE